MSKSVALAWGLLILVPIGGLAFTFYTIGSESPDPSQSKEAWDAHFDYMRTVMFSTQGVMLATLASYIVYLFKTKHVPKGKKALWAVVLFMGNIFAMPIFWYHYIWKPASEAHRHSTSAT